MTSSPTTKCKSLEDEDEFYVDGQLESHAQFEDAGVDEDDGLFSEDDDDDCLPSFDLGIPWDLYG